MSSLRIENLSRPGVSAGDVTVAAGTCAAVFGASGSGKTLLLRAIADLDEAKGEVWLDQGSRSSMTAPQWRRQVVYVAAESHWWARLVGEHAGTWPTDDLQSLGFEPDVLNWEIQRLSSGERQRLAILRALAYAPSALLLDEPTANLDRSNAERVEQLIAAWRRRTNGCALWVSHDPAQRTRVAAAQYQIVAGVLRQVHAG
jgi:ABC-type iron transport system FetAB ATPase subunit